MKTIVAYIGWGLAIILLSSLLIGHSGLLPENNTLQTLKEENAQLQQRVAQLEKTVAQYEKTASTLKGIEDAASEDMPEKLVKTEDASPHPNPEALLKGFFANMGDAQKEESENKNPLQAMFSGPQGEKMQEMGIKMTLNMQYGPLFSQLNLSPEREEAVREILHASLMKQMKMGMSAMDHSSDRTEAFENIADAEQEKEDQLRAALTPEEWAAFEEYEKVLPERMLKQSYEMQLRMGGTQLSDTSLALVRDVLTEEMLALEDSPGDTSAVMPQTDMETSLQQQTQAFENALQRLEPTLQPEEYTAVERFVQQQKDTFSAMMSMFDEQDNDAEKITVPE